MIKLIASDMDGTLLDNKHKISEENIKAMKRAQDLGIKFTIITGRDYYSAKPFVESYGLECEYIVLSGAEYRDKDGNVVSRIKIDNHKAKKVLQIIKDSGLCFDLHTNKGSFVLSKEKFKEQLEDIIEIYKIDVSQEEFKKYDQIYDKLQEIEDIEIFTNRDIDILRINTFSKDKELIAKLKEKIRKIEGLSVSGTRGHDIEVNDIEAQKGLILAKAINKMGIERDDVIVFGDSFNDYSMFTEFKNSFAMENAIPEIKAIAKYITDSNENSGVAKGIYMMIGVDK